MPGRARRSATRRSWRSSTGSEAMARLKMAQADVKEKQAVARAASGGSVPQEVAAAQLEAAEARAELAQHQLDRLTLRAPFAGRIVSAPVSAGQFVLKGTVIAELADVTSLKALVPVDRRVVKSGTDATVFVEEQEQTAKVQSVLPLLESYAQLRELAAPFASAWIRRGESPRRARAGTEGPQRDVAQHADRDDLPGRVEERGDGGSLVQVIRNEYVTNVPVEVLGRVGQDRIQISGALRPTDALIASSSVPLLAGTLVRFGSGTGQGIEGTTPNPARAGVEAGISPPSPVRRSDEPHTRGHAAPFDGPRAAGQPPDTARDSRAGTRRRFEHGAATRFPAVPVPHPTALRRAKAQGSASESSG